MKHLSEDDLITFHLHEGAGDAAARRHLEGCGECAALSASIAETLRVFSAGPVPEVDLDRNWRRLRGNLSVLSPVPKRGFRLLLWPAAGLIAAVLALAVFLSVKPGHVFRGGGLAASPHRGPLTDQPADPEIARQLDSAERLLTEVNHASGPLDEGTRKQAESLLLKNAVYVRDAREHGDLAEAAVLEKVGHALTNISHETPADQSGWHLRVELNTDGLLFELRVLRQNDPNF